MVGGSVGWSGSSPSNSLVSTSRGSGGSARTRRDGAIAIMSAATTEAPTTSPTTNCSTPRTVVNGNMVVRAVLTSRSHHSPEWWNGRHDGLKIRCSQGREGSNPSSGTTIDQDFRPSSARVFFGPQGVRFTCRANHTSSSTTRRGPEGPLLEKCPRANPELILGVPRSTQQRAVACARRSNRPTTEPVHEGELVLGTFSDRHLSCSITRDALTFVCVPPERVCRVSAAVEEWFLNVSTSPAERLTIIWPSFCCVPAPDP
jgi:hypothetical protein